MRSDDEDSGEEKEKEGERSRQTPTTSEREGKGKQANGKPVNGKASEPNTEIVGGEDKKER